ncbi:unnamed protein product, partial [Rotaria magnacalcarata]
HMIGIFSSVAWNNIGYIDWEPWLAQIFTRILRGFSVPVGKMQLSPQRYRYSTNEIARWIIAMMGNGSACLKYLGDLLMAMKSFYHPSNTGRFQESLSDFFSERKAHPLWWFQPRGSYRLTEQNITDFVNCIKDYVFISIFNKEHGQKAIEACKYLSMLRPELIVPPVIEKLFSSIENITEPHRFTAIVDCLTYLARQLVRQTSSYSEGQAYVLPLLMSVLPGIDLNDPKKIYTTLKFLNTVLSLITCVDCSSAVWGQPVDFDRFQMQYHIPNVDEIDFACEFVKAFLYSELTLLNEKILKLSNQERSRSLSFVYNIALGYFHMIPRIESEQLADLVLSVVPYNSKYQFQTSTYMRESKFNENLRMRLVNDIGKLLDLLVKNHLDDVASMKKALEILSLSSIYYGVSKKDNAVRYRYFNSNKKIFKNQMCDERRALRFLAIETMALQIEDFILSNSEPMTHIDEQVVFRLFELSLHQYIEIRRTAQSELFSVLNHYAFSSNMIADRIVEVLKTANETDHDQVKGCLYILLGNDSFFLPTKISWSKMEKLWPSIASVNHSEKRSITNLIQRISHKIEKLFVTKEINQNANEESTRAAITLWCAIESKELETGNKLHEQQNLANTQSYNNLMEQLNSLITSNTLQVFFF